MSNLTNNTTKLEALLAKVNALPEADSGEGGASVEAWTGVVDTSGGGLGSSASVLYYMDETLTARILGDDGGTITNTITIAANTVLYFSRPMDVVLTNAENITATPDLETYGTYGCTVIRPTANNFSVSRA